MNKINIISNNPKNIDCLINALIKTLNATTINVKFNEKLTIKNNKDKYALENNKIKKHSETEIRTMIKDFLVYISYFKL